MKPCSLLDLVRDDVKAMQLYVSARSLSSLDSHAALLDANEMPFTPIIGTEGYNRYADQQPKELIEAVASFLEVDPRRLLVSRGADEAIDLLVRLFCRPSKDSIFISPPAFPMYARAAMLNGSHVIELPLCEGDFTFDVEASLAAMRDDTKLVFVCTPHNPVGKSVPEQDIITLATKLKGRAAIVVDEAYIEFSVHDSAVGLIDDYDNIVVLRTLSKSMGLAGVRLGGVVAHEDIINELLKVLAVYPVPVPVLETVLTALEPQAQGRMAQKRDEVLRTKECFIERMKKSDAVEHVFPSDANFVLLRFKDAASIDALARKNGFILRDQDMVPNLKNCIRISIGTRDQMADLAALIEQGEVHRHKNDRVGGCHRKTKETSLDINVNLDAVAPVEITTGLGFFDHMLEQIAVHGGFSLVIEGAGDTHVDPHHLVEDIAIALGQTLHQALGSKGGIKRYGFTVPMDESLAHISLDLSGRGLFVFKGVFDVAQVGDMPTSLVAHFFRSLAENMQVTMHLEVEGADAHHQIEACFKAFGRVLRRAVERCDDDVLPSTKGSL